MQRSPWPKYDPRLGSFLCQRCWDCGSWAHRCVDKTCDCFRCHPGPKPKTLKFSRETLVKAGQLNLLDNLPLRDAIAITKEATYKAL
jgi:hypothetical protein